MLVEIFADELHGSRRPTIEELETWFVENYDGEIEYHAEMIPEHLDQLLQ